MPLPRKGTDCDRNRQRSTAPRHIQEIARRGFAPRYPDFSSQGPDRRRGVAMEECEMLEGRISSRPPLACRPSPPQVGRSRRHLGLAQIFNVGRWARRAQLPISPPEGEMAGRPEGGDVGLGRARGLRRPSSALRAPSPRRRGEGRGQSNPACSASRFKFCRGRGPICWITRPAASEPRSPQSLSERPCV